MPHDGNYGPKSTDPKGLFGRVCPCGIEFRTNHPFQRYHAPRCKRQAQNRRHYQRHGDQIRATALRRYHQVRERMRQANDPTQ